MYSLVNKRILVLSPQEWNDQNISKHHYSRELVKAGNKVLFFSRPSKGLGFRRSVLRPESEMPDLYLADYQLPLPYWASFQLPKFYKAINSRQLKKLIQEILGTVDLCIDFGNYHLFSDLHDVEAKIKIYFPVDDFEDLPLTDRGANFCLSVSTSIINKMAGNGVKINFIHHGLSWDFEKLALHNLQSLQSLPYEPNRRFKVGYSGNLMIPFLDRELFRNVVESFHQCDFYCYGNYSTANEKDEWLSWLKSQPNIKLYGILGTNSLAIELNKMDLLWLCYMADNKNYSGDNSHKIMEYLATGKVIISLPVSIYHGLNLLEMPDKDNFIKHFDHVINNISEYNSFNKRIYRIHFSLKNTYKINLSILEGFCSGVK